jgi:dTDP-4-dehydrorhamnose 3,5-epimerase
VTARFEIAGTELPGVCVLQRMPVTDERGWLERLYSAGELAEVIGRRQIVDVNRSRTRPKATVRGLHYQVPPSAELKIVSCLRGEVFDVAVDLRRGSPTFLRWHAELVSEDNHRSLVVPEGFAHGFQTMVDDCELLYLHTAPYDPASERRVHPLDPLVAIDWPLAVANLWERDSGQPPLPPGFDGIAV